MVVFRANQGKGQQLLKILLAAHNAISLTEVCTV
jgi:hypothetical protein